MVLKILDNDNDIISSSENPANEKEAGQKQSLLDAGIWYTAGNLISGFLTWLLILVLSRTDIGLGPEGVGVLNVGTAIFACATILALGIRKSTSQKVAETITNLQNAVKEARNGAFATFIVCMVIGVGLIVSSFFLASPFSFQNRLSSIFFIVGGLMFINWFRDSSQSVLAGYGEYNKITIAYTSFFIIQFIAGVLLVFIIKPFGLPVTIIFIAYAIGIIVQILFLYKYFKPHKPFNPEIFRFHIRGGRPFTNIQHGFFFAITEIVPFGFLGSFSLVILQTFTNDFAISGAYSIVLGYAFGGLMVTNFAWPLITHVADAFGKGDVERIRHNLQLIVKIFYYVTFLLLAISIGGSQGFLSIFHGAAYLQGATDVWLPFIFTFVAYAIAAFEYLLCGVLLGVGKRRPAAIYLGIMFLLTIGFSTFFLWLSLFSPQINASIGFLLGTVVMAPFLPYLLKKHINQKPDLRIGLRSLVALICTLFLAFILVWPPLNLIHLSNLFIFGGICILLGIVFLILLVFFGAISKEDFDLLERKIEEYKLKKYLGPILGIFRRIMKRSPFCNYQECVDGI